MEFREELELLLNNFIITKENNRDDYYKIKSKIKKLREFTMSKLGCDIIINSSLIKLEKIPSQIDNTYKIESFNNREDYVLFMLVIMFLEDKAKDEQFIFSNLIAFITNIMATIEVKEVKIDFLDYSTRKSIVDVLKYLVKLGAIKKIDGDESLFKDRVDNEVLYENTGISHYIVRTFKEDIFTYDCAHDFLNTFDVEDVLNKKRYFTYRSLLYYPLFHYKDFDMEIYNYFINYRNRIVSDLNNILDGELLIYDDVALLTTVEKNARYSFPNSRKMIHDIILLVHDYLINEIDDLKLTKFTLEQLLIRLHQENKMYFSKEYREMNNNKFFEEVVSSMEQFGLVKVVDETYIFSPIVYVISGNYPKEEEKNDTFQQLSINLEEEK